SWWPPGWGCAVSRCAGRAWRSCSWRSPGRGSTLPSDQPRSARGTTGSLLASELRVLLRRGRTWAMFGALAAIPVLLALVVFFSPSSLPGPGRAPPLLDKVTQNGMFVSVAALVVPTPLFLPLTISVVSGDTIAGEAGLGTLRYLLVAPAGRLRLLAVKYAGA